MRLTIGVLLLLTGLIVGWFGHRAVFGTPNLQISLTYDDWRLNCPKFGEKNATCNMQSDLIDPATHGVGAQMMIARVKDVDTLFVTLPLDSLLEPGFGIQFDSDKPKIYQFDTCTPGGCVARVDNFNADVAKGLISAKSGRVLYVHGSDGKVGGVPISFKGFVEAHKAFLDMEAKRRSWWRRLWS